MRLQLSLGGWEKLKVHAKQKGRELEKVKEGVTEVLKSALGRRG